MALEIGGKITVGAGISVASETGRAVAVALANTPWIYAWRWSNSSGFGEAYTGPTISSDLLNCEALSFHPAGNAVVLGGDATVDRVQAWQWSSIAGFGTKYANPSGFPTSNYTGRSINFNRAGTAVAAANLQASVSNLRFLVYTWDSNTGFGTRFTDPATTLNTNGVQDLVFTPTDQAIIYGVSSSDPTNPGVKAVRWNNTTGFGSAYSSPATYADFSGSMNGVAVNPAGTAVAATGPNATTSCYAWSWSDASGFGSRYSNPASVQAGQSRGVQWSPSGQSIAVVYDASPYIAAWTWTDTLGFGTRFSNPTTLPAGPTFSLTFNFEGTVVFTSGRDAAVEAWQWSDTTGFGTKYSAPATAPTSNSWNVSICP